LARYDSNRLRHDPHEGFRASISPIYIVGLRRPPHFKQHTAAIGRRWNAVVSRRGPEYQENIVG
jgi:hypothetical protein